MKSWVFNKLCCISTNKEQMVFECGSQKITMEYNPNVIPNIIPLGSYDFELTENEKGNYKVSSFNKDKFGIVEFVLESYEGNVTIEFHMDSFNREDMKYFSYGNKFNFKLK